MRMWASFPFLSHWELQKQSFGHQGLTHRRGSTPRCFLWLSDCCKEGPRALPEGWCCRTWFMWPGIASLELISRKRVSKFIIMLQLHRPVPSEASCPPWTAQTGSEDKVVSEHHSKVTVSNSRGRNKAPCLWPLYPNTIWCLHMTLPLNHPEKTPLTSFQKNTHTHTHTHTHTLASLTVTMACEEPCLLATSSNVPTRGKVH